MTLHSDDRRPPALMSCETLARELDCSKTTVNDLVKRGVIPRPIRLSSGMVRWSWASVQAALASLEGVQDTAGGSGEDDAFLQGLKNVKARS
jgi:predicted DNA-binding transcriptional regulator AlpA